MFVWKILILRIQEKQHNMITRIEQKIEKWKNKLLDLGKRNRLLNYRETKRSSLNISIPDCISLWNSFVTHEKPLEFPYYDEYTTELKSSSHTVQTNQNINEMFKTLRSLRDRAKLAKEEQGINILYLSFGFLKWTESFDSDYIFNSPIILVPVTLTVESITSPYILSLHEDEIVVNPTLCHKLYSDFGITLPDMEDIIDIKQYLESIKQLVAHNKWEVGFEVGLSLLSFLKINMYNDLIRHEYMIKGNAVIRTISGDESACIKIPKGIIDFDFDKNLKPTQVFQVVDADSSQQDAILCAKKGISFVLQGPPGTGKSQTITNIISECLAEGKKVLFVSEKMAALEVVHKRLTNAELDDFCLILHSHKANKRAVLEQLGKVLKMAEKKIQLNDEVYQKLDALQADKEKLNDYAAQLAVKIAPLDKSIFEVNGILAHLTSYEEVIFGIRTIIKITKDQYNRQLNLLAQLAGTIGKLSEDYFSNPWNGANVAFVSNELRHDVGAKLITLIPKMINAANRLQTIFDDLSLEWKTAYTALLNLIPTLNHATQSPIIPLSWIYDIEIKPLFNEIPECEELQKQFLQTQNDIETQYQIILANNNSASDGWDTKSLNTSDGIKFFDAQLKSSVSAFPYSKWNTADTRMFALFDETKEKSAKINELQSLILSEFEHGIFDVDCNGIYSRYKADYTSFFKNFKPNYWRDKKAIRVNYKTIVKKVTDEMILETVAKLRKFEEFKKWFADNETELSAYFGKLYNAEKTDFHVIEKHFETFEALKKTETLLDDILKTVKESERQTNKLVAHYQFLYNGFETQWENIRTALDWAAGFKKQVQDNHLNRSFVENVCSTPETAKKCEQYAIEIQSIIENIDVELQWFLSLFDTAETIKSLEMPTLQHKLEMCGNNLFLLEEWIDFRNAEEDCRKAGLTNYINKINELHIDRNSIIPVYKKRFFRLWLDAVLPQFPAILNFRRRIHESTISEFSELDKLQLAIAKVVIKSRLIDNLPHTNHFTSGFDEIGILKHEMNKRARIMPVRKLFKTIPNLLLTLKPCFMMSPLSVSLFLEGETYKFDTVIFDEASQVCTENAIGAIFRGKQVIIAGDSKQLPPTNFFMTTTSDVEYDVDDNNFSDDTNAYESILDEANLLPERTLLWHYRSRHEHLIAFSNAKIYGNNLITFPSNIGRTEDNGVEYMYVKDGFYDRGGKKGNVVEARKVAELVFEHFNKHPNRSLGVIAFGEVQQQAIDTEIRLMRLQNQQYERFFYEENNEPFFLKNLENVQGDERDTIIFSIGYAKDAEGVFRMNFGPLSKSGGERRLNVAITRAKFNVKLIGSIMPADIDLDKISSDGPKLLRGYIEFAINGADMLMKETVKFSQHDSSFEEAIYNFIDREGYELDAQIGCSEYRIDMAIKHPNLSGIYVLGIECDGATYHSARTARERDRLRQNVLENMGWKIYHIWSADWIKDPITEGEKLIEAINEAIRTYGTADERQSAEESDTSEFVTVDNRIIDFEQQANPYRFDEYQETNFDNLTRDYRGNVELTDGVILIINNEYPLHYELLCQKIAPLFGNEKVSSKIKREVDRVLRRLGTRIYRNGDFLYPSKNAIITVRMPNKRKINHIAVEEIAVAMAKILASCIGVSREGLCIETRKVYGFNNSGTNIATAMNTACSLLLRQGKAKIVDGKIVLCG
jgi:very-short-patch-repair endonuclease